MARHTPLAAQGDESASRRCIDDADRAAESLMSEGAAPCGVILLSSRRSFARRWSQSPALQGLMVIASFSLLLATRGAHGLTITSPPPRQWAIPPAQLPSCKVSDLVDEIESVTRWLFNMHPTLTCYCAALQFSPRGHVQSVMRQGSVHSARPTYHCVHLLTTHGCCCSPMPGAHLSVVTSIACTSPPHPHVCAATTMRGLQSSTPPPKCWFRNSRRSGFSSWGVGRHLLFRQRPTSQIAQTGLMPWGIVDRVGIHG